MRKSKILLIILLGIFCFNLISASGIMILNNNTAYISKTVGSNYSYSLQLRNDESFAMYNVSLESNSIAKMNVIPALQPGENITATIIIYADEDISKSLRLKGFYFSNIGQSNLTHEINVFYDQNLNPCSISVVKGDIFKWNNMVPDDIKMIRANTGQEVTTILRNTSYQTKFENPETFDYYFTRRGFQFSQTCSINILNDNGLINNPLLDGVISFNVDVNYPPTTISTTFLETSYNMNFYDSEEGIFSIRNTGNNIVKNINLSGNWFSFTKNNFDIDVNQTKSIGYTIHPSIGSTTDTNKTYNKNIFMEGNFNTLSQNFSIFIKYADVSNTQNSSNLSLLQMIDAYCKANPDICSGGTKIIYKDANGSDTYFNVTYQVQQVKDLWSYMFSQNDQNSVYMNFVKDELNKYNDRQNSTDTAIQNISNEMSSMRNDYNNSINTTVIIIVCILFIMLMGLIGFGIFYFTKKKKEDKMRRMV